MSFMPCPLNAFQHHDDRSLRGGVQSLKLLEKRDAVGRDNSRWIVVVQSLHQPPGGSGNRIPKPTGRDVAKRQMNHHRARLQERFAQFPFDESRKLSFWRQKEKPM